MKNVFAVKYQKSQTNASPDGDVFITRTIDTHQKDLIDCFDNKVKELNDKVKLPIWLLIIYYALIFISIAAILGIVGGIEDVTLQEAFNKAPWLFILLPITFAGWIGIALYKRYKTRSVTKGEELKNLQAEALEIIEQSKAQLGIPSEAIKMDTLHYFYDEKDGKVRTKTYGSAQYFNVEMHAYVDQEHFYLADLSRVFSFSLSNIKKILIVNQAVGMDIWNKKEPINSPTYSEYRLKTNSTGAIFLKPYLLVIVNDAEHGEYSIMIPGYEKETLEKLTGVLATNE